MARHAARQRRALLRRSVHAWVAMMETEAAGVERLLEARARRQFRRRRGVAFSRWRKAAETTREKHRVALEHREAHVRRTVVLRPWLALRDAARERERAELARFEASVAEAERRFASRVDATRRVALDAFRANRERGFRAERASRYFSRRRDALARSRVWANWAVLARDSRVALERHAAMRRRSRLRAAAAAWRSAAARDRLERALESRRETALRGFKKVGAWRLVERVTLAWCHLVDDAARGRHNVALMRKVRVATRVVREWAKRVDAGKTYRAAFARVVSKGGKPVQWTTPMGLPVVQPYKAPSRKVVRTIVQSFVLQYDSEGSAIQKQKQKSAFPPNFIHSVDSAHMMKTALACQRRDIAFAGVHDSFWTHARDVDAMNEVIRDTFVELHSEPLMTTLYEELRETYPEAADEIPKPPPLGELDLNEVKKSRYFFS